MSSRSFEETAVKSGELMDEFDPLRRMRARRGVATEERSGDDSAVTVHRRLLCYRLNISADG
jgi:hypothetical protein